MKIIITGEDREKLWKEKMAARAGCNSCPTCFCNTKRGGLRELSPRKAIFQKDGKRVIGRVDRFECTLCGTV